MSNLLLYLKKGAYSCVVKQNNRIYTDTKHGIMPILHFYESQRLKNAFVADRVIGKAAAFILVLGEVQEVSTMLISEGAYQVFETYGILVTYEKRVPYIINRKKDGMCPMEECVLNIKDPNLAYEALKNKVKTMNL